MQVLLSVVDWFCTICLTLWESAYEFIVPRFRQLTSSFRLPYQHHSSCGDCATELFKGSNESASLCVQSHVRSGCSGVKIPKPAGHVSDNQFFCLFCIQALSDVGPYQTICWKNTLYRCWTSRACVWGAVHKNIICDRFTTKTALSAHI